METPKEIVEHQAKYKPDIWQQYSLAELGQWVHLFTKRSDHRTQYDKKMKDLTDARNYCAMMREIVDAKIQQAENEGNTANAG